MLESTWRHEADSDVLKKGERIGQIVGVVMTVLVALFLLSHWTGDTGFYTSEFNGWDALVLFAPLLYGIVPSSYRALIGRKNVVRPVDILGMMLFVISAAYFLCSFHFDMQFFADPLPEWLRFIIDWIDEGWAKLFLALGIIGGTAGIGWTILAYLKVKELLSQST